MRKLLLLTDIPPCRNYTAGLALDQFCRFLPKGSLACFAVVSPFVDARLSPDLDWIPVAYSVKPREDAVRLFPGKPGGLSALAVETWRARVDVPRIAQEAIRFGKRFGADAVWCVLQGQTMIRLALPVARGLGVPLLSQVWDPPSWWVRHNKIDRVSAARIFRAYEGVLRSSEAVAAASWAMAERYSRDYGVRAVPLVPGLDPRDALPPAAAVRPGGELVIGLAGQLYSSDEWNALVAALDGAGWVVGGRAARIRLMGRMARLAAAGPVRIEYLGWATQQETIRRMSEADILYCPYWFDPEFESEARLCFPSKLTTYLAAGRPVFFHGPSYASPSRFLDENGALFACPTLDPGRILDGLARLAGDPELYARLTRNGRAAFDRCLTHEAAAGQARAFLGVDAGCPAPES